MLISSVLSHNQKSLTKYLEIESISISEAIIDKSIFNFLIASLTFLINGILFEELVIKILFFY